MRRNPVPFLIAEGCLYAAFLGLDLFLPGSGLDVPIKYLSILLCFSYLLGHSRNTDLRLTRAALAFTLLADLFLLVLDRWYTAGVASFCVVQVLYLIRLQRAGRRPWAHTLAFRGGLAAVLLAADGALGVLDPLTALTLLYFSQLTANAFTALALGRRGRMLAVGLFLFMGCDLCVGLCNLAPLLPEAPVLVLLPFAQVGMWLFYLPSQVLITLSAGKLCD